MYLPYLLFISGQLLAQLTNITSLSSYVHTTRTNTSKKVPRNTVTNIILSLVHYPNNKRPSLCPLHQSMNSNHDIIDDTSSIQIRLQNGLTKMNKVMTAEFFESTASLKSLHNKCSKHVIVKPSSIKGAGMGLFATKNIKAGSIVSFYPAHTLGMEFFGGNDDDEEKQIWVSSNDDDRNHFANNPPGDSPYLHATDQPIFKRNSLLSDLPQLKNAPIYLDANPNRQVDSLWVSHYINDGALVPSNDEDGIEQYYKLSKQKKNCVHCPIGPSPIMATVATRKIKKGEELFTSYGCIYWLGVLFPDCKKENAPGMNQQIQKQIRESAQDLFTCMNSIETAYGNEVKELESAFNKL